MSSLFAPTHIHVNPNSFYICTPHAVTFTSLQFVHKVHLRGSCNSQNTQQRWTPDGLCNRHVLWFLWDRNRIYKLFRWHYALKGLSFIKYKTPVFFLILKHFHFRNSYALLSTAFQLLHSFFTKRARIRCQITWRMSHILIFALHSWRRAKLFRAIRSETGCLFCILHSFEIFLLDMSICYNFKAFNPELLLI